MKEPNWLDKETVLAIHHELLARFGGLSGVRDEGLLDSALNRPLQLFHNEKPTIFQLATAYAHGLVKNHPFNDGNKRIGFMSAYTFLGINRWQLEAPEEQAVILTRDLAAGEVGEAAYAQWLKDSCRKRG